MPPPEQPTGPERLFPYQKYQVSGRIYSDAELRARGAGISDYGTVAPTDIQLELISLLHDNPDANPQFTDRSAPVPGPREEWLDTDIRTALGEQLGGIDALPQPIRRMKVPLRNILVLGQDYMHSPSVHGVGKKSIDMIGSYIAGNEFGLEWKDKPTPEDIAHICHRLGQVTANALGRSVGKFQSKLSVDDVLRTDYKYRRSLLKADQYRQGNWPRKENLCNGPELFAFSFNREKLEIERQERDM